MGTSPFGLTLVCFHASCWALLPAVGSPESLGQGSWGKGMERVEVEWETGQSVKRNPVGG